MKDILLGLVGAVILIISFTMGFAVGVVTGGGLNKCGCQPSKVLKLPNTGDAGAFGEALNG